MKDTLTFHFMHCFKNWTAYLVKLKRIRQLLLGLFLPKREYYGNQFQSLIATLQKAAFLSTQDISCLVAKR